MPPPRRSPARPSDVPPWRATAWLRVPLWGGSVALLAGAAYLLFDPRPGSGSPRTDVGCDEIPDAARLRDARDGPDTPGFEHSTDEDILGGPDVLADLRLLPVSRTAAARPPRVRVPTAREVSSWVAELDRLGVRSDAMTALRRAGRAIPSAVPSLLLLVDDSDPRVRAQACATLGAVAGTDPSVVDRLVERLVDSAPRVVRAAAEGLVRSGPEGASRLARAFDADESLREEVSDLAVRLDEAAEVEALRPMLEALLTDRSSTLRVLALRSIAAGGALASACAPAVVASIPRLPLRERAFAAEALGELGVRTSEVEAALEALAEDPSPAVRAAAARARASLP